MVITNAFEGYIYRIEWDSDPIILHAHDLGRRYQIASFRGAEILGGTSMQSTLQYFSRAPLQPAHPLVSTSLPWRATPTGN